MLLRHKAVVVKRQINSFEWKLKKLCGSCSKSCISFGCLNTLHHISINKSIKTFTITLWISILYVSLAKPESTTATFCQEQIGQSSGDVQELLKLDDGISIPISKCWISAKADVFWCPCNNNERKRRTKPARCELAFVAGSPSSVNCRGFDDRLQSPSAADGLQVVPVPI